MSLAEIIGTWTFPSEFRGKLDFIHIAAPGYWFQFIVTGEDNPDHRRAPMLYTVTLEESGRMGAILFGFSEEFVSQHSFEKETLILARGEHRFEYTRHKGILPDWYERRVAQAFKKFESAEN